MKKLLWTAMMLGLAPAALGDVLYYGGDPDDGLGLGLVSGTDGRPFNITVINNAWAYDDFVVPAGGWTITALGGHFLTETPTAFWLEYQIRTGVSEGVAGTSVSTGIAIPTVTANGFDQGSRTGYYVEMALPTLGVESVELGPGTYWLGLFWRNNIAGPGTIPYLRPTVGVNAVGGPFTSGAFWDAPEFGMNFVNPAAFYGVANVDLAYRIQGTAGVSDTPEPGSWFLMAAGLGSIAFTQRKRLRSTQRYAATCTR